MTHSAQARLLGYLLGTLDDSEQRSVDARLKSDPRYRRELVEIRRCLEMLEPAKEDLDPPDGLADRTCRFVFSQAATPLSASGVRNSMSRDCSPPSWIRRIGWLDAVMAVGVFFATVMLTIPALQHSRFKARVTACQNNLRQLGLALTQYSEKNQGYFPSVPTEGNSAVAGIYAPVLLRDGFLTEASWVVCADSPLARQEDYRIASFAEIQAAAGEKLTELRRRMGGSYGYCLGHMRGGTYQGTRNLRRENFALMADAPSADRPRCQTVNHSGRGQNVLFEDGRVRFLPTPEPSDFGDDFFHNDAGVVAAGVHPNDSVIGSSDSPPIIYVNR